MEYPLPHEFEYQFYLAAEDETKNSTICTLIRNSTNLATPPDSVEVNPRHSSFAEETGPTCQPGSIVPRMSINMTAFMPIHAYEGRMTAAAVDNIANIRFNWMPIYMAFVEPYDSVNDEDGTDIEGVLEMTHNTAFQNANPLFDNVKLLTGTGFTGTAHPMGTVNDAEVFGDYTLDTSTAMEAVTFDSGQFFDNLKYGTNKNMLKKVTGRWNTVTLQHDRPYHFSSNNRTFPAVKRINPFTFCGILFHVPQLGSAFQLNDVADCTATFPQVGIKLHVSYPEWNSQFDQTAM